MLLFGEVVSFGEELLPLDEEPLFGVELLPLEPVEPRSLEPVVPVDPLEFVAEPSDELLEPLVPVVPVVPLLSGCDGRAVSAPFEPSVLPDDPVDGSALLLP